MSLSTCSIKLSMMTFLSSYHESKNFIFEEFHLTLLTSSNDSVEFENSIEFWDSDCALFRISSIKIWRTCHCCWENSIFCQLLFSSDIFAVDSKINSMLFVFRDVKFDVTIVLSRRWKKDDDEIIWNRRFNRSRECERKITKRIIEIVFFETEMNVVNWSLIQSRKNWLFRYVSIAITKFRMFLRKRILSTIHSVEYVVLVKIDCLMIENDENLKQIITMLLTVNFADVFER